MENKQKSWEDWATETFVGDNYYYYKTKWEHKNPNRAFTSWNWAAFFFPFYWMVFRKMYLYAFLFLIVSIVGGIIPFSGIVFHCLLGSYANYLYFKRSNAVVQTASQYSNDEARMHLNKHGGTSVMGLILSITIVISLVGLIFWGLMTLGENSDTASAPRPTTYEVTSDNNEIIVTAPIDYDQETESGIDLYLTDNIHDSELIFNIFPKENYTNTVNEQYFVDLMVEHLKSSYSMRPVNNKELLALDHQAPQALYTAASGIHVSYFYFTCEKFDQYYVLTTFTISPSDWDYIKDKIANTISSVRPNDSI